MSIELPEISISSTALFLSISRVVPLSDIAPHNPAFKESLIVPLLDTYEKYSY